MAGENDSSLAFLFIHIAASGEYGVPLYFMLHTELYNLFSNLLEPEQIIELFVGSMHIDSKEQARVYARQIIQMCQIMDSDNLGEDSFETIARPSDELLQTLDNDFFSTQANELRKIREYASSIKEMMRDTQRCNDRPVIIITKFFQQEQYIRKPLNKLFYGLLFPDQKYYGDFTISS